MLSLKNIRISYEASTSLLQLDELSIKKGELVALLGLNGSGKSSLIRTISRIDKLTSGEVWVDQKDINSYSSKELAKVLSLVLTDSPFPRIMSLEEFVAFGRYPFTNWLGKQSNDDLDKVEKAIQFCGLEHLRTKDMGDLSDGERQRARIARTLTQDTDLVILDEPTTHLDSVNTSKVLKLLKKEAKELNKSILYSSHKVLESLQLADKLWIIHQGKLIELKAEEFLLAKEIQKEILGDYLELDKENESLKMKIQINQE